MQSIWILAQTETAPEVITADDIYGQNELATTETQTADPNGGATGLAKKPKGQWQSMIFIVLIFVVMYFIMFRGPKKKQQQQKKMIQALKKNDRVQTVGGILGTVIEVGDNEVTLKVDESNNTKLKVLPTAVSRVIEQS